MHFNSYSLFDCLRNVSYKVDDDHVERLTWDTTYAENEDIKALADAIGIRIRVRTYGWSSPEPLQTKIFGNAGPISEIIHTSAHFRPVKKI